MNVFTNVTFALAFHVLRRQLASLFAEEDSETYKIMVDAIPAAALVIAVSWQVTKGTCYVLSL